MAITYRYGEQEVKDLARQAGKAQAAQQQLQRQFQKEIGVMQFQMELESQRRSKMWELEKAEIASRNDFAREERIRAQKLEERDRKLKAIEESDIIPPDKKEYYRMQVMGVEGMTSPAQQAQIDIQQEKLDYEKQQDKQRRRIQLAEILADPEKSGYLEAKGIDPYELLQLERPATPNEVTRINSQTGTEETVVYQKDEKGKIIGGIGTAFTNDGKTKTFEYKMENGALTLVPSSADQLVNKAAQLAQQNNVQFSDDVGYDIANGINDLFVKENKGVWNAFFPGANPPTLDVNAEAMEQWPGFGGSFSYTPKPTVPYDPGERVRRGLRNTPFGQ